MREEKKIYSTHFASELKEKEALVVFNYGNLGANDATSLRKKLREHNARLRIMGKRMFKIASLEAGYNMSDFVFDGSIGILQTTEGQSVEAIKVLYDYSKEKGEGKKSLFTVQGGVFEGEILEAHRVKMIAELPSMEQLKAQLLGVFEAPMSGMVGAAEAVLSAMPSILDQKTEKES